MFVYIILDVDYLEPEGREKWFLKVSYHARNSDTLIITHECFKNKYKLYSERCDNRFWNEFDMCKLTDSEECELNIEYISDEIFDRLDRTMVSRSEVLKFLFKNNYEDLENELVDIINRYVKRLSPNIEGIFCTNEAFKSVRDLGKIYDCNVWSFSFSAIRKMHKYMDTLYLCGKGGTLKDSKIIDDSYIKYKNGKKIIKPIFSRRELLALFGKQKNFPLINMVNADATHEVLFCRTPNSFYPQDYIRLKCTDTDLYYEIKRNKSDNILVRSHPNIPWDETDTDNYKEHHRNDPVSSILSCNVITSIDSMIILKGILWNRYAYVKGGLQSVESIASKSLDNLEKVSNEKLNFYIFYYLIPDHFMFDLSYWRWRVKKEVDPWDIYERHLQYYLDKLGIDIERLISSDEEERLEYILKKRKCDAYTIEMLRDEKTPRDYNYDVLSSMLTSSKNPKEYYCKNIYKKGCVFSKFIIKYLGGELVFYPFVDVGGFARIVSVKYDGEVVKKGHEGYKYIEKNNPGITLPAIEMKKGDKNIKEIVVQWEYFFK